MRVGLLLKAEPPGMRPNLSLQWDAPALQGLLAHLAEQGYGVILGLLLTPLGFLKPSNQSPAVISEQFQAMVTCLPAHIKYRNNCTAHDGAKVLPKA